MSKTALITVGTTEFDRLIDTVIDPDVFESLTNLSVSNLVVQFGRGLLDPSELYASRNLAELFPRISLVACRYKPSLVADISRADIVIGHAGAGTTLECLEAGKLLVVVTNDTLQDQHQAELAGRFAQAGYLHFCDPPGLKDVLSEIARNPTSINPYVPGDQKLFADWFVKEIFH